MPSSAPKSPAAKRKQKGARASPAPSTPAKPWLQAPASSPSPSSAVVITPVHSKTKPIVSPRRPPGSRGRILAKLAKEGTSGLAEASRRQRLAQMSEHKYYQVVVEPFVSAAMEKMLQRPPALDDSVAALLAAVRHVVAARARGPVRPPPRGSAGAAAEAQQLDAADADGNWRATGAQGRVRKRFIEAQRAAVAQHVRPMLQGLIGWAIKARLPEAEAGTLLADELERRSRASAGAKQAGGLFSIGANDSANDSSEAAQTVLREAKVRALVGGGAPPVPVPAPVPVLAMVGPIAMAPLSPASKGAQITSAAESFVIRIVTPLSAVASTPAPVCPPNTPAHVSALAEAFVGATSARGLCRAFATENTRLRSGALVEHFIARGMARALAKATFEAKKRETLALMGLAQGEKKPADGGDGDGDARRSVNRGSYVIRRPKPDAAEKAAAASPV